MCPDNENRAERMAIKRQNSRLGRHSDVRSTLQKVIHPKLPCQMTAEKWLENEQISVLQGLRLPAVDFLEGTRIILKPTISHRSLACSLNTATDNESVRQQSSYQLRHTAATKVRREMGYKTAGVTLGHTNMSATAIYAERNQGLSDEATRWLG